MDFTLGEKMKKLIISFLVSLFILPIALACTNPVIYNEFGAPINIYGTGILIVKSSDFPSGSSWVKYPLNVSNRNSQNLTVNFTPASEIALVVKPTSVALGSNEQKVVDLEIDVRVDKAGQIYVTGKCGDGLVFGEGAINFGIDSTSNNPPPKQCNNNILSCGISPDCQDLTKIDNKCTNGYLRDYWCSTNTPRYKDTCSNTCCRAYLGSSASCKLVNGASRCIGPEVSMTLNITNGVVPKSLNIVMFESGTQNQIFSSDVTGSGILRSSFPNVDLKADYGNSNFVFTLRNLTFSSLGTNSNLIINNTNPTIGTLTVYKAFYVELPNGTSFKNISLQIKIDNTTYKDVNALAIYRCGNYDIANQKCNESWTKQTTKNSSGYATAEVTSFSAYLFGEPSQQTTTTTTTLPTTTTTSSYGGSSSSSGGGSSSSGSGGSGGSGGSYIPPVITTTTTTLPKATGFYNYPSKLEIKSGSSRTFTAEFFNNYKPSLKSVAFNVIGVNSTWLAMEPLSVDEMFPTDTTQLTITITVPSDATTGSYPVTLQATSPSTPIRYESSLDLTLTQPPVTTTTTTTLPPKKPLIPVGLIDLGEAALTKGWPIILAVGGLAVLIRFYPRSKSHVPRYKPQLKVKGSKGTFYKVDDDSPDYVRLEMKEPEPVVQQPKKIEQEIKEEKKVNTAMEETRKRVIEEIRRKAMREDKRYR